MERKHGWKHSEDTDRVINSRPQRNDAEILNVDGEYTDEVFEAKDKKYTGEAELWSILGPVEYKGLVITQNTRIWHDEMEVWLQAKEIDVVGENDPTTNEIEPAVTFLKAGQYPTEYLTLFGNEIEQLRETSILCSQEEVDRELLQNLEQTRRTINATV